MGESEQFINRELSWLEFNSRILGEARDTANPLFERLKFLSITASNLDEFFMVRVASLKDKVKKKLNKTGIAGLIPYEQLIQISKKTHELVDTQYSTYNRSLIPALKKQGIDLLDCHDRLSKDQGEFADRYFIENVYPVLTPMAVDSSRPFPLVYNRSLNLVVLVKKECQDEHEFAMVQVPGVLPRIIEIPVKANGKRAFILLEEIIKRNMKFLFSNYEIVATHMFRIMRNADLSIDEEEAEDLLKEIQKKLKKRQWGEAIRLEVEDHADKRLLNWLKDELAVTSDDIYEIKGPLDLTFLMKMYQFKGYDHLKEKIYEPQRSPAFANDDDIFNNIRKGDILLHHPYESFGPVIDFVKKAARDPDVLAIKQTLYRVSGNSPIIAALAEAADFGKQVTVLVELKARFDEENNINWAKVLEKAGCHVIYGLVGLKTHSKITLVVRKEKDGIRRYVHLGTGNYNDTTARLYTDCGLFTCHPQFGEDATAVFNMLSGYSEPLTWNKLIVAPIWMKKRFLRKIQREKENAQKGKKARIIAKMNSLCDKEIIQALYDASAAGVSIELIVRGICSLRAGVTGLSDHIRVRSIVGNFLEHSRIFYFENDGCPEYYMGSADWMPRNLERRVEIVFPVEDKRLQKRVMHILQTELDDNVKAYYLQPDNSYEKEDKRGKVLIHAQRQFCEEAIRTAKKETSRYDFSSKRVFIPVESHN